MGHITNAERHLTREGQICFISVRCSQLPYHSDYKGNWHLYLIIQKSSYFYVFSFFSPVTFFNVFTPIFLSLKILYQRARLFLSCAFITDEITGKKQLFAQRKGTANSSMLTDHQLADVPLRLEKCLQNKSFADAKTLSLSHQNL